ncbi:hypothetical protein EON83_22710 [bacterium]|nr:MAG: hypothetical protein EON83_22710 [bacterium]
MVGIPYQLFGGHNDWGLLGSIPIRFLMLRSPIALLTLLAIGILCCGGTPVSAQNTPKIVAAPPRTPASEPPPSKLRELWVLPQKGLSPAEAVLAQTLQGLVNKKKARVWLRSDSILAIVEEQLKREGVQFHEMSSPWELLKDFRSQVKGAIVYRLNTPSINVATSLCGPMKAVAIDESLLPLADAAGLKVLADVRAMDDQAGWDKYHALFARGVMIEQATTRSGFLRDLPVALNAFTMYNNNSAFRTYVARELGPQTIAYGWGPDEYGWVRDLSRANATAVAADWCSDLSALRLLPAGKLQRPKVERMKAEPGVRYIAFVMSDGDNIQWLSKDFVGNSRFWASPLRGKFPISWEMSPILAKMGPRVLQYIYATATQSDDFIAGPGAPGYTFLHSQTDRLALAKQAAPYLRDSDLPIVSVLNENAGSLAETIPLLDQSAVSSVIYKDYSPYNRRKGDIVWHRGKPCLSYKFMLWSKLMEPDGLVRGIEQMPTDPLNNEASYALVNMHAWSWGDQGGPLVKAQETIDKLPPNTRVVTATQIMQMLSDNFSARHAKD